MYYDCGPRAMNVETTVWACSKCGKTSNGPSSDVCSVCGSSMAQLAESDAINKFMLAYEPPGGWYDYDTMRRDWLGEPSRVPETCEHCGGKLDAGGWCASAGCPGSFEEVERADAIADAKRREEEPS